MTVSMRVVTAGDGYKYVLKSVAAGDGDRAVSTPLTRYYTEVGWANGCITVRTGNSLATVFPSGHRTGIRHRLRRPHERCSKRIVPAFGFAG
ncbi:MAG: hypothetical protein LBE08_11735 [Bifidobacteriaceae bacterium]|jgi:hypothetical protein|nr:hypothetical protein [Bifidobacteriaceae bacterium]